MTFKPSVTGSIKLLAIQVGHHEQLLLLPDDDHLYRALAFLDAGQVKAASVHVRTAFELSKNLHQLNRRTARAFRGS